MGPVNQVQEIKHLSEDLFINTKGIFPGIYMNLRYQEGVHKKENYPSASFNPVMMIQRNLRDDTFNVRLKLDKHIDFPVDTNFQIDGKTISDNIPAHDYQVQSDIIDDIIPHSLIKDAKFSQTKSIAAGLIVRGKSDDNIDKWIHPRFSRKDFGAFLIIINNLTKNQNISVTSDNIIHIKTINSIKLTKNEPLHIWRNTDKYSNGTYSTYYKIFDPDDQNNQEVTFEYSYNHIYLKPAPISRYKHNKKIYDIFMSNDDSTPIIGDMNIKNGIMASSETGSSKMQIGFHSHLHENKTEMIEGKERKYIGHYQLEDYSYYDYDKNKTIFGPSTIAERGDFIPYNLKGNYIRQLQLALNCDFDALKIYQSKKFDQAVLKPFGGSVKINLTEKKFDNSIIMNKLSKEAIKNIKENFNDFSLRSGHFND